MKTIKPLKLGVLHRTFENDCTYHFVPTFFVCFPLGAPEVALQEMHMWKVAGEALGTDSALDECMPKIHSEVLVSGMAYTPGGKDAPACQVRLRFGPEDKPLIDKRLYVLGDRYWQGNQPSEPTPFRAMQLGWTKSFGGAGYAKNPLGKGAEVELDEATGVERKPLPNIEDPEHLVLSPRARPEPVGLGSIPLFFEQRMSKGGTYDARWQKDRYPGFPEDIDWTFFNTAPEDQWVEGRFSGGERFSIENMHPEEAVIESRVPSYVARCFITRDKADGEEEFREVPMQMDTVHLFPNQQCGVVVFRGVTEVNEDDAADIKQLVAACERSGEARPVSHYQQVLAQRMDRARAHLYSLRDSDLFPPRPEGVPPVEGETLGEEDELLKTDLLPQKNARRKAEKERDAMLAIARQQLIDAGVDPDEHIPKELEPLPPIEEPPDMENIAEYVDEQMKLAKEAQADAERKQNEMMAQAREECEKRGIDFDKVVAENQAEQGGPPKFSADEEFQKILDQVELGRNAGVPIEAAEAKIRDPELMTGLMKAETQLKEAYRKFAQHFPAAASLAGEEAATLRAEVAAAVAAGESLKERDLTGADLSGMNLSGVNLSGAFLEASNLESTNLSGADLTDAVLARANLTDAVFSDAKVTGTNFGEANLLRTNLSGGLDLSRAVFGKARLTETNLSGARLDEADFMDAVFSNCDLTNIKAEKLNFVRTEQPEGEEEVGLDFGGSNLSGAQLVACNFLYANLQGCDVSNGSFRESVFLGSRLDGVNFDRTDCTQLRVVHGSAMPGATFRGASLEKANLRSTDLKGCDFSCAKLKGSDLSESDLEGANLSGVSAPGILMMKANLKNADLSASNLMEANLQKSNIEGANFTGANLFRVDFALIKGNDGTNFDGANMKFIRFVDRSEKTDG